MRSLICAFVVRIRHKQVFSWRGLYQNQYHKKNNCVFWIIVSFLDHFQSVNWRSFAAGTVSAFRQVLYQFCIFFLINVLKRVKSRRTGNRYYLNPNPKSSTTDPRNPLSYRGRNSVWRPDDTKVCLSQKDSVHSVFISLRTSFLHFWNVIYKKNWDMTYFRRLQNLRTIFIAI